ncbi:MAG: hypothetical protein ACOX4P_08100 [Anaerovoracaceae bacterium]
MMSEYAGSILNICNQVRTNKWHSRMKNSSTVCAGKFSTGVDMMSEYAGSVLDIRDQVRMNRWHSQMKI